MLNDRNVLIWASLLAAAFMGGCINSSTEIPNEVTGTLYLQNGGPAVNAEVTLYPTGYLPGSGSAAPSNKVQTDSQGQYHFTGVTPGQYNVLGRIGTSGDSLFYYSDSLFVSSGSKEVVPDTLRQPGTVAGRIELQPEDDPTTATVQATGTGYYTRADSTGKFQLTHLAQGNYRLRVITTLANYSPTFNNAACRAGQNDTLAKPIFPPYSSSHSHFALDSSTVALWTFDSRSGGIIKDWSPNGFDLSGANNFSLASSPYDSAIVMPGTGNYLSRASATALTIAGTGKMTFEARIFITQYTSTSNDGGNNQIVGTYEGLSMGINSVGQLSAGAQKVSGGTGYWDAGHSSPDAVPLNQWVDVAAAFDNTTGQCYLYINGVPIKAYFNDTPFTTDPWRTSTSVFCVGGVITNNVPFNGQIDEVRVSNNLALGVGLSDTAGTPP